MEGNAHVMAAAAKKYAQRVRMERIRELPKITERAYRDDPDLLDEVRAVQRPRSRLECADGIRPCPWVGCRYHLFLDVEENGSIKVNFPRREWCDLEETCALDVAANGGETLDAVGKLMNVTRERVRQIESRAMRVIRARARRRGVHEGG